MMTPYFIIKKVIPIFNFPPFSFIYKAIYKYSYLLACLFIKKNNNIQIWARNSFANNTYQAGISDIDVTIVANDRDHALLAAARWRIISKINPLFHELNLYLKYEMPSFQDFANYFEASRDTLLCQHLKDFPLRENLAEQAVVYLLRQVKSDFHNLCRSEKYRVKKWNLIFSTIHSVCPQIEIPQGNSIIEIISKIVSKQCRIQSSFDLHFLLKRYQTPNGRVELVTNEHFQFLFPQLWLTCAIESHPLTLDNIPIPIVNQTIQVILLLQVHWEIWGLHSQHRLITNTKLVICHLKYLLLLVKSSSITQANHPQRDITADGIEVLIQSIQQLD